MQLRISRKPWTSKQQPDGKGAVLIDADGTVIATFLDWRDCEDVAQNSTRIVHGNDGATLELALP